MNSSDKFLCIINKSTGKKFYSSRGVPFKSKTGALNSFITFYRNRKFHKDMFEGVPKTGVHSKETADNIKIIFNTYFDIEEV